MEDPSNRTFSGDPVATVLADRGRYIAATLTIARAYLVAGQPNQPRRLASFERWSDLVCGALRWLKWEDPVNTMSVLRADDPTRQHLAAVHGTGPSKLGMRYGVEIPFDVDIQHPPHPLRHERPA